MIPTPGQIEQEYLGQYHNKKGTFYSVNQDKINLKRDVEKAKKTTGYQRTCDVNKSIDKVVDIVSTIEKSPFS
jgi:hypothetical protein